MHSIVYKVIFGYKTLLLNVCPVDAEWVKFQTEAAALVGEDGVGDDRSGQHPAVPTLAPIPLPLTCWNVLSPLGGKEVSSCWKSHPSGTRVPLLQGLPGQ